MTTFGPLHISLLLAIVAIALTLVGLCRHGYLRPASVCAAFGSTLALNEIVWWIWRYSREGIHTDNLPLQLCDAAVWFAVVACLTRARPIAEFTWFAGIAGAGMAILTPDLAAPWPQWPAIYFFLSHAGVVISAALIAFSGVMHFRPRSVWRAYRILLGWALVAGCIDFFFGANYMYLRMKPKSASALDLMPPWPWYILVAAIIGWIFFWLLWLPVRPIQTGLAAD
jgi:hypothetical integral membrane protein (TIGR02206 family)